jgi:phosphatidylglycerophosphatase A
MCGLSEACMKNNSKKSWVLFVAQGAYSGRMPGAPGTAGTLLGVLLYLPISTLSPIGYLSVCVLVGYIGVWAAGEAENLLGQKDAPSIVIDEIVGYFVSMFMVPFSWGLVIAGFVLFRIFDIIKPWPIRKLEGVHGGAGVMLDDIGAGIYTNLILQLSLYFIGGR